MHKEYIKKRDTYFEKKIGNFGLPSHSISLLPDLNFMEFSKYTLAQSKKVLNEMGYNLDNYLLKLTQLWVQEFPSKGGGHHNGHIHYNTHLSWFYF